MYMSINCLQAAIISENCLQWVHEPCPPSLEQKLIFSLTVSSIKNLVILDQDVDNVLS